MDQTDDRSSQEHGSQQKQLSEDEETHLLIIESPYRSLARPLLAYIDTIHERHPDQTLTVILPEFVVTHWWEYLLHNQTAFRLKAALLFRPGIIVADVPQHLRDRRRLRRSLSGISRMENPKAISSNQKSQRQWRTTPTITTAIPITMPIRNSVALKG